MATPLDRLKITLADRYTLERELGAGGMATVYLAHDLRHNRKVAIKVLRPEVAEIIGGRELVYRKGDSVMAASMDLPNGRSGQPVALFGGPYPDSPGWTRPRSYDVSGDGERFLLLKRPPERERPRVNVVVNWFEELRAKVPR